MNKQQARMMLAFIADLYAIIQTPDPIEPAPTQPNGSGKTNIAETVSVSE